MRMLVAAFLMGGLFCAPALAAEKAPVADTKPDAAKPVPAKPAAHVPANKPVDYGDMRCAFAVRHSDVLDGQIIAWAGGFLEGYAKANPDHVASHSIGELTDPAVLRSHIRGYCLKHREKPIGAAVLAMVPHAPHATATPEAAEHPAAPAPHPAAPK